MLLAGKIFLVQAEKTRYLVCFQSRYMNRNKPYGPTVDGPDGWGPLLLPPSWEKYHPRRWLIYPNLRSAVGHCWPFLGPWSMDTFDNWWAVPITNEVGPEVASPMRFTTNIQHFFLSFGLAHKFYCCFQIHCCCSAGAAPQPSPTHQEPPGTPSAKESFRCKESTTSAWAPAAALWLQQWGTKDDEYWLILMGYNNGYNNGALKLGDRWWLTSIENDDYEPSLTNIRCWKGKDTQMP